MTTLASKGYILANNSATPTQHEAYPVMGVPGYVRFAPEVYQHFEKILRMVPREQHANFFKSLAGGLESTGSAENLMAALMKPETKTRNRAASILAESATRLVGKCGCVNEAISLLDRLVDAVDSAGEHTDVIAKALDEAGRRARALRSYQQNLHEPTHSNAKLAAGANDSKKQAYAYTDVKREA